LRLRPVREIGVINTGVNPASSALTCNGCHLYVANNNEYGLPPADSVSVLDLDRRILIDTIYHPSFKQPYRIAMYGTKAFVANSDGYTVSVIDTTTRYVTQVIEGFDGPSGFAVLKKCGVAYVNNYGAPPPGEGSGNGHTIQKLDLCTGKLIGDRIEVGLAPADLVASPDEQFVYVIDYVDGKVGTGVFVAYSVKTGTIVASTPGLSGPFWIDVTPDGRRALVANFGSNDFTPVGTTVSVICLSSYCILQHVLVGIQPAGLAVDPCGDYAYLSNYNVLYAGPGFTNLTPGTGTLNVLDLRGECVTLVGPTVAVGQGPNNVVVDPCRRRAYVTNYVSGTVSVVALSHRDPDLCR
jgi:YVTN family beta-propeller protein